jgi:hypothetical protein
MTTRTARNTASTEAARKHVAALGPAPSAGNDFRRLHKQAGQSAADLTSDATTWYARLDTQPRAGCDRIARNQRTRETHTLSLTTDTPAVAPDIRWAPGNSRACGAGSGRSAAPGLNPNTARPPAAHVPGRYGPGALGRRAAVAGRACRFVLRHEMQHHPAATAARTWLTVATSRGSPGQRPPGRGPTAATHSGVPGRGA